MSEPPPTWNITPPLDPPGPGYRIWREPDTTSDLVHGWDWATTGDQPGAVSLPAPYPYEAWLALVADAAQKALPALEQVISLWPYPVVDIKAVDQLVRVLHDQAAANTQPEA